MPRSHDYKRSDRVSELLRQELSDILLREMKDPRLVGITVTRIVVSDDLRSARVSYGVLDRTAQVEEIASALEHAAPRINRLLVQRLQMKTVPRVHFHFDRNLDYSVHISRLLASLQTEGD